MSEASEIAELHRDLFRRLALAPAERRGVRLSAENRKQLWIPPGFAHGFLVLSDCGAGLWEILRHGLLWYLSSVAKIGLVYGSFTTAVVLLFYMELAAILLLIGAQVIAEVEQR